METVVRNLPSGGSVEFSMSGQAPQVGDSTGTAVVPFIADFLSRSNYKLNLLEDGDEYLVGLLP